MTQTLCRLGSKKPNPIKLNDNLSNNSSHRSSLPEIPLSPREKEILETTNFATPPPIQFRTGFVDHLSHSLSSDNVLDSGNDVFDGPEEAPPKPPKPIINGRPLSVSDLLDIDAEEPEPPPLPPKRFPRSDKKLFSQTSFDWSQVCQSSNCTSNCDSMDSCLNYSGLNHLSADDLLSMSRSDADPRDGFREFRSQTNSYNTNTSSEESKSTNSYNFSRYEFKTLSQTKTTTKAFHSLNNSTKDFSNHFSSSNSSPFQSNYRMESLIDRMKSFKTSISEDTVDGDLPPQLPVKMRPKLSLSNIKSILDAKPLRPPSEYDNISDYTVDSHNSSQNCHELIQRLSNQSNSCSHSTSCPHFRNNMSDDMIIDPNNLENRPPPLPPKKKNIMAYMQMVGSYAGPDDAEFYRHSVHTYQLIQSQWQAVEMSFLQQKAITTSFVSATSSDDSVFSFESEHSSTPPPLLPPKKSKIKVVAPKPDDSPELMPRTSTPVSLVPSSESGISSQSELTVERIEPEEVSALDETDVSAYIVLKKPTEEGPDIRGGSVDGLIVKATEVSKNGKQFINEIF